MLPQKLGSRLSWLKVDFQQLPLLLGAAGQPGASGQPAQFGQQQQVVSVCQADREQQQALEAQEGD